jgi:hypothetical protein
MVINEDGIIEVEIDEDEKTLQFVSIPEWFRDHRYTASNGIILDSQAYPEWGSPMLFMQGTDEMKDGTVLEFDGEEFNGEDAFQACVDAIEEYNSEHGQGGKSNQIDEEDEMAYKYVELGHKYLSIAFALVPDGKRAGYGEHYRVKITTQVIPFSPSGVQFKASNGVRFVVQSRPTWEPCNGRLYLKGSNAALRDRSFIVVPNDFQKICDALKEFNEKYEELQNDEPFVEYTIGGEYLEFTVKSRTKMINGSTTYSFVITKQYGRGKEFSVTGNMYSGDHFNFVSSSSPAMSGNSIYCLGSNKSKDGSGITLVDANGNAYNMLVTDLNKFNVDMKAHVTGDGLIRTGSAFAYEDDVIMLLLTGRVGGKFRFNLVGVLSGNRFIEGDLWSLTPLGIFPGQLAGAKFTLIKEVINTEAFKIEQVGGEDITGQPCLVVSKVGSKSMDKIIEEAEEDMSKKNVISSSLAGTGEKYVMLQARIIENGSRINIQGLGEEENRAYGVAVKVNVDGTTQPLANFLRKVVEKEG